MNRRISDFDIQKGAEARGRLLRRGRCGLRRRGKSVSAAGPKISCAALGFFQGSREIALRLCEMGSPEPFLGLTGSLLGGDQGAADLHKAHPDKSGLAKG